MWAHHLAVVGRCTLYGSPQYFCQWKLNLKAHNPWILKKLFSFPLLFQFVWVEGQWCIRLCIGSTFYELGTNVIVGASNLLNFWCCFHRQIQTLFVNSPNPPHLMPQLKYWKASNKWFLVGQFPFPYCQSNAPSTLDQVWGPGVCGGVLDSFPMYQYCKYIYHSSVRRSRMRRITNYILKQLLEGPITPPITGCVK